MKDKLKHFFTKRNIILLSVFALLTVAFCVLCAVFSSNAGAMRSQYAAERFRGESEVRFAQVSAFFPEGQGQTRESVHYFREKIDPALIDAGLEQPETGSLWKDAYCGFGEITVTGKKSTASVTACGVGGDWFYFHPLRLKSGSYIAEGDLMHDKVVLNTNLAWKLFGALDVAGMTVTIGGEPYIIAGVVEEETDRADVKAFDGGGLYMYYDALEYAAGSAVIECYELICADPLNGFALDTLSSGFPGAVTVENTGRFSVWESVKNLFSLPEDAMVKTAVALPYWENAARYTEVTLALLLIALAAACVFPAACALYVLIRLVILAWRKQIGRAHV